MIKKILIYLLAIIAFSCDVSDDGQQSYQELLPVESAEMPQQFEINSTYEINLTYLRPTNCHAFNNIYYRKHNNERTVAIISTVFQGNGNCEPYTDLSIPENEASFNFLPTEAGSYIFKFWKGVDENGQDDYLIYEIPVVE